MPSARHKFYKLPNFSNISSALKLCPSSDDSKNEITDNLKARILPFTSNQRMFSLYFYFNE